MIGESPNSRELSNKYRPNLCEPRPPAGLTLFQHADIARETSARRAGSQTDDRPMLQLSRCRRLHMDRTERCGDM